MIEISIKNEDGESIFYAKCFSVTAVKDELSRFERHTLPLMEELEHRMRKIVTDF